MAVSVRPLADTSFTANDLGALAEPLQRDPTNHVAYYATSADAIVEELDEVPEWRSRAVVAFDDRELVGWLVAECDEEVGRIWWWGPVVARGVDRDVVADRLYELGRSLAAESLVGEELAADDRNTLVRSFAARHGFVPEEASVALEWRALGPPRAPREHVRAFRTADARAVAGLHDALFPGTHTLGSQLVAEARPGIRLVAEIDGSVVGYVIVEVQPGDLGYVDYVGVSPGTRGRGIGRELVGAALDELGERGVTSAHLTVRESNDHARRLYRGLGFVEDRLLRPYRKGFLLDG